MTAFRHFPGALAATLALVLPLLHPPVAAVAASLPDDAAAQSARVLELTNAERTRAGLAPLSPSPRLSQAAQQYSEVLATDTCFAHTCGPVPDMIQRDAQVGYTGWTAIGENIAAGYPSPEEVVAGWMASPGHRANILNPDYRELGVGLAAGGKYGTYWTQEFGSRGGAAAAADSADDQ